MNGGATLTTPVPECQGILRKRDFGTATRTSPLFPRRNGHQRRQTCSRMEPMPSSEPLRSGSTDASTPNSFRPTTQGPAWLGGVTGWIQVQRPSYCQAGSEEVPGALGAPDLQPEPRGPGAGDELEPLPMERFRRSVARRGRPLCSNRPIPWTVSWEPFPVSVGSSRRRWTAASLRGCVRIERSEARSVLDRCVLRCAGQVLIHQFDRCRF